MEKKKVIPAAYEVVHNKAVRQFKKMSLFILWSGILNIVSALVAVLKTGNADFALSYGFNDILFRLFMNIDGLSATWLGIIIVAIAVVSGLLFALLGIFANMGNLGCLIAGTALYILDFIAYFIFIPAAELNVTIIALHVMFTFAFGASIFLYFKVLDIQKKFHKV